MNKFLALQKDVFDISKITVVGNPTITSDGVASGYSSSNIVQADYQVGYLYNKSWTVSTVFKYSTLTAANPLFAFANEISYGGVGVSATSGVIFQSQFGVSTTEVTAIRLTSFVSRATIGNRYKVILDFNINTGCYTLSYKGLDDNISDTGVYTPTTIDKQIRSIYLQDTSLIKAAGGVGWPGNSCSIDLKQFKIYVDNQLVFQPVKPTYLIERRKPKVWNKGQFTVVGNPSISESGFISNCSGSNYAKINSPTTSVNNKFQVDCTIPIGTGVPFVIYIGNNAKMYFWRNANNKLLVVLRSTTTDLLNTTVTVPETSLNVKCIVENNTCLVNVNGETLINETITASAFFEMLNSAEYFTFGSDIGNNPFNQPLDLKTFKIYTDNTLVFDGGAETYVYDPSKFTIVGSPTITEYGVASGFTTNNYVTFNSVIDTNKTFNFKGSFVYKQATASQNVFHSFATTGGQLAGGCRILLGSTGNLILWAYTGTADGRVVLSANNFADGDNIDFEFSFSNNKRELKVSKDGGSNWITGQNTTLLNFTGEWQGFTLGFDGYAGSIDLPSFSITVDGKEVFTGAKENYYMLRR